MPITTLRITDFRNLTALELAPSPSGLNIICGNNGSGKTSLLEAIYYLGHGRSFRTSLSTRLIRHTTDQFSIFSQLVNNGRPIPVGISRHANGAIQLRVAEKEVTSITQLAYFLPTRLINSQSHNLFESGPTFRRKYLDWGLFYQSDHFLTSWRHFERVLKQRNIVLKEKRSKSELDAWTEELIKHGLALDHLRREYVSALTPLMVTLTQELLSISHLTLRYQSGWNENMDYASVLAQCYPDDYRFGYTQLGPHRADLDIHIDGMSARHFLSRGQQKLLICAMILAQGMLLEGLDNTGLIYLVDDLPSELDLTSRDKLISLLSRQQTQIFITAVESEKICELIRDKSDVPMKVFHVEHGSLIIA